MNIPMTPEQRAEYERRRFMQRPRSTGLASGLAALGSAIMSGADGGAGPGSFPPAPPAPGQGMPMPGPNLAQYQAGGDGRSMMGANPRWHSTGGGRTPGGDAPPAQLPPGFNFRGEPVGPDAQRKDPRRIMAALGGGLRGPGLY